MWWYERDCYSLWLLHWNWNGNETRCYFFCRGLPTLPEHLSSPPIFSEVRVTRSLVWYVCFVDRCLSSCTFSFGHCVVCSTSIYGFWLPLLYLQTLLIINIVVKIYTDHGYVPFVVITNRSFPYSGLITGFVTRVTLRVPHVKQELPSFPEHLRSPPVCSWVHVAQILFSCVVFCRSLYLYVLFFFLFFWPLHCPSFSDLRLLITLVVSFMFLPHLYHDLSLNTYFVFLDNFRVRARKIVLKSFTTVRTAFSEFKFKFESKSPMSLWMNKYPTHTQKRILILRFVLGLRIFNLVLFYCMCQ